MLKNLKGLYLIVTSLFLALLHLPFALAKSAGSLFLGEPEPLTKKTTIPAPAPAPMPATMARSVYDSLQLGLSGLNREAFDYAKKGYDKLLAQGKIINSSLLSIADFSQSSRQKRLYIIDLKNYKVLFNTWVAHGRNSGAEMAYSFSNANSSFKSSPGFYVTRETYSGKHGYSLKLDGLEKGINDRAYERAIVMHGADYVSPSTIATLGFIGRSHGCPAVPLQLATPIINTIRNGSLFFIYNPSSSYLQRSPVLR